VTPPRPRDAAPSAGTGGDAPRTAGTGGDALKLVFYFGEHDRHGGRFLAEVSLDLFERAGLAASVLLRGAEGFGARQLLRTDRLLSLSEDLPLVAVAVDRAERIEAVAAELAELADGGLLTLERARFAGSARRPEDEPHGEVKVTVYTGRHARLGGAPAHVGVVAALHRHGVAGATALLGVDGTAAGRRLRARFLAANRWVPAIVVAVGERERIAAALAELGEGGESPLATLEAVRVLRRDGVGLASEDRCAFSGPYHGKGTPISDPDRPEGPWTKLSLYCSERSEHAGRPLYLELIRRLRAEGAAGATALRGVWGYHGDHAPHGDRLLALRRHVPILVQFLDAPARAERWLALAAELSAETGLLTAETVPRVMTLE
jgi:PII-like signaling protein